MNHLLKIAFTVLIITGLFSCRKKEDTNIDPNKKSFLSVEFDNVVGADNLALNTGVYTNSSNEMFNITKLKYFVSNFVLTADDNTVYTVPQQECYFLIDESDPASCIVHLNVPQARYKNLQFIVGVDSARSSADLSQRTGSLDVTGAAADMYWTWNSGYIFFKMEGTSAASPETDHNYLYHIGGFSNATINNIKTINLDLSAKGMPIVKEGRNPNVHLFADIEKLFDGSQKFSIAQHPAIMNDPFSAIIAQNYANMFSHNHTD